MMSNTMNRKNTTDSPAHAHAHGGTSTHCMLASTFPTEPLEGVEHAAIATESVTASPAGTQGGKVVGLSASSEVETVESALAGVRVEVLTTEEVVVASVVEVEVSATGVTLVGSGVVVAAVVVAGVVVAAVVVSVVVGSGVVVVVVVGSSVVVVVVSEVRMERAVTSQPFYDI